MPNPLFITLGLSVSSVLAMAQTPPPQQQPTERIVVSASHATARDARTLSEVFEARRLFNALRALSPNGELAFRVLARLDGAQTERLGLQLLTPEGRADIDLDALQRFRPQPAWDRLPPSTVVRSRLRDGNVVWRSDVRTPGLPDNVRRLGDLRLQCKLDWGVPLGRTTVPVGPSLFVAATAQCETAATGAMNSQFADRPVLAIDLVYGTRRERLSYFHLHGAGDNGPTRLLSGRTDWAHQLKDHMYRLPLHDRSWPDDTLVEFTFMNPMVRSTDAQSP